MCRSRLSKACCISRKDSSESRRGRRTTPQVWSSLTNEWTRAGSGGPSGSTRGRSDAMTLACIEEVSRLKSLAGPRWPAVPSSAVQVEDVRQPRLGREAVQRAQAGLLAHPPAQARIADQSAQMG